MARTPLIAGNWKMNLNHLEAIALVQKIAFTLPDKYYQHVEVAVIPPFTALRSVQTLVDADKLKIVWKMRREVKVPMVSNARSSGTISSRSSGSASSALSSIRSSCRSAALGG